MGIITTPTKEKKKEIWLKNAVIEYFFNKYMVQEEGVAIKQRDVIDALRKFCETRLSTTTILIEKLRLTLFLKRKGIEHKTTSRHILRGGASSIQYLDLTLNKKGLKYFFPDRYFRKNLLQIKENLTNLEIDSINSIKACKMLSCEPSVQLLVHVVKSNNLLNKINLVHTIHNLRAIEKVLFRKNLYRTTNAKVGCALYVTKANNLTQKYISKIVDVTEGTIRKLIEIISDNL